MSSVAFSIFCPCLALKRCCAWFVLVLRFGTKGTAQVNLPETPERMALLHFLFEMVMWFACKAINTTVAIATCTLWCIIYAYALCEFTVQGLNWLLFDSWQPCTEQLSSTSDDPQQVLHPAASVSDSIMDCAASCLADRPLLHRKDPSCLPFDARRAMFEPVSADQVTSRQCTISVLCPAC